MTVAVYAGPNVATGNGVSTVFPYSYRILEESDLAVYLDGVLKSLTVDYTVSGEGDAGGGNVTFVAAPGNGVEVTIERVRPYARVAPDYQRNGAFDEETVEADFDAAQMQIQQIAANVNRAFKAPRTVTADQVLTAAMWAARANKALGFDGTGAFGTLDLADLDVTAVSAFFLTLVGAVDSEALRGLIGTGSRPCRKNAVLNGGMNIWQRGATITGPTNSYTADCWLFRMNMSAGVADVLRSADVPTVAEAGRLFNYSLQVDITTLDAAVGVAEGSTICAKIEGYNWAHFAQRDLVLSFWVKSSKTGIHCVYLNNDHVGTPDRAFIAEYTVNVADTWERKTITIPASPSAGTWNYTNRTGAELGFALAAGTNLHGVAGAWQSTVGVLATVNQVNVFDSAANNFRITGVQLELGDVATDFDAISFVEELVMCERYYQKSFNYDTAPAQNAGVDTGEHRFPLVVGAATVMQAGRVTFRTRMGAEPTITLYNPSAANAQARNITDAADHTATAVGQKDQSGFDFVTTTSAGGAAGETGAIHWQAAANL